jgi:hypothetical protein
LLLRLKILFELNQTNKYDLRSIQFRSQQREGDSVPCWCLWSCWFATVVAKVQQAVPVWSKPENEKKKANESKKVEIDESSGAEG